MKNPILRKLFGVKSVLPDERHLHHFKIYHGYAKDLVLDRAEKCLGESCNYTLGDIKQTFEDYKNEHEHLHRLTPKHDCFLCNNPFLE